MKKLAAIALALMASGAVIAAPSGFNAPTNNGAPQGFTYNAPNTVEMVRRHAYDDQIVTLQGKLTAYLGKDHYEFTDLEGNTIEVELDDDRNWNNIAKDQPIEITGEVDKDLMSISIDVKRAVPLQTK